MSKFTTNKFFLIKFFISSVLSVLIYLSFRMDLIYENNLKISISFLLIQLIIFSIIYFSTKSILSIIFYNLFFIVLLNLALTPLFNLITFDVPSRQPNFKTTKEYKSEFFKGALSGKHFISTDEKGYRTNKKIDYINKDKNTLRIFTIGASTTEQGSMDDNKTWSSLLEIKLSKFTDKDIEVINVGMAGLRSEYHYVTLKRIRKYKPDLVIFLIGINDWNHHIINSDKKYLISNYEIKYNYKKSILFNVFGNINKQINRNLINKKKIDSKKNTTFTSEEFDLEAYLLPQIDSLNIRKKIKKFRPKKVSGDYQHWLNLIIKECKTEDPICLFLDQPTAYKKNISNKLKKRLWMTPPNQDYTLSFDDLIFTSFIYNNWLRKKVIDSKLNFHSLSDKIEANTDYLIDDCHFSESGSQKVSDVLASYINLSLKSVLN